MENQKENTESQEFENNSLDNAAPEPTVDTDTLTPDEDPQDVAAEAENDKMADAAAEWQDKYIRLAAEFDNFRKRTLKEKMELITSGGEDMIKAIIPVIDDFERALAAMEGREHVAAECEGVRLIYQKFMDILKSKGVTPIEALGKPLDVDYHDAVAKVPVEEADKKGVVIDVVQTGYMLKDKVLRFAKVVVGE